jgi:hypothetical protein
MGKESWFSRAVAKMSSKTQRASKAQRAASEREGGMTTGDARARTEASAGETTTTTTTTTTTQAQQGTGKRMCVEDFEPLKLIGRGAFGA